MCGQHNVRASAEENTGQNTDKGHAHNPRTEIKIPDPAGNRTRAAGQEDRDSTDHATATDIYFYTNLNIVEQIKIDTNLIQAKERIAIYTQFNSAH